MSPPGRLSAGPVPVVVCTQTSCGSKPTDPWTRYATKGRDAERPIAGLMALEDLLLRVARLADELPRRRNSPTAPGGTWTSHDSSSGAIAGFIARAGYLDVTQWDPRHDRTGWNAAFVAVLAQDHAARKSRLNEVQLLHDAVGVLDAFGRSGSAARPARPAGVPELGDDVRWSLLVKAARGPFRPRQESRACPLSDPDGWPPTRGAAVGHVEDRARAGNPPGLS